ncbi:superoxide dismutase [Falsihalocynthiibacter arcticus]|uniref:Superoxide dismutase n=1 Tax=Falsihalocynthiibacter arcticus TaxID=1579316 RepID=A0A126V1W0_9RHOB|nr:superoxide dismutase [Falsihalocynthiibacter arcticus]AML52311.1 superoxide dismutase [Falsihalocynthiibacter arcticus]
MAFTLPDLPYAHDALADNGMSAETLQFHHDLHHNAYVTNGNAAIAGTEWDGKSLEDIITGTYNAKSVAQNGIFNNISQLWNHNQFWEMMSPGTTAMPSELEKALVENFGSVDEFKTEFAAAGAGQFGSGWCWLVKAADGGLKVTKTENGVNPLCFGQTALLGCDVWEHSYYIDFRNKRPVYLSNFLEKLVNWENVASRLG